MSLAEIIPSLRALPRAERFQLLQYLAGELAREEGVPQVEFGGTYPIWSPIADYDAAAILLRALDPQETTP